MPTTRDHQIMVYLTNREYQELQRRAAENARSLSAELRYGAHLHLPAAAGREDDDAGAAAKDRGSDAD
jgi:hypothetical protein